MIDRTRTASKWRHQRTRLAALAAVEELEGRRLLAALTIAQENQLPGTPQSQWDIGGAGDTSLQGYATDISVNQGQTVNFKIDDKNLAPYHLDIYRMGYYGGLGARKVATITSADTARVAQPAPLTDATTGLVDAGNWSVTASWQVPADATSGIYFAKAIREDTGGASHIVFIVRNDTGHSDLLFQTADTTWQAYNNYGGNSVYVGNSTVAPGRGVKVSYNRPFNTRALAGGAGNNSWVFATEYPLVRFLERNGYDVSYFTGVDTDRFGSELLEHKAFLSTGHDEYWSAGQRSAMESARNAGVNLAFLGGNDGYWKTRWETSIDGSGTPYRTLVTYKESKAGAKIDPTPVWTGAWRDASFSPPYDGGRPENALIGTLYTVDRGADEVGTPFTASSNVSGLRFWRNTAVANLTAGQTLSLGDSVLGYEWNEDLDNGFRPAGLFDLSSTTQTVTKKLQDLRGTTAPGTATHSLTLYRAPSGALVFSAGMVQWSWGLDAGHEGRVTTPDVNLQQATVNLLADMRAQPATLMPGLVAAAASTDATRPTSTISSPAANATVHTDSNVVITGTASDAGGGVVGGVEVSVDGGATWHKASGRNTWSYSWSPSKSGPAVIMSRAVDDSGNIETPALGRSVNVVGPVSLWSNNAIPSTPAQGDTSAVELGLKFRSDINGYITGLKFYKGAGNTGTHVGHLWSSTGTLLGTATFTNESATGWQQADFPTPVAITANTTYVISYFAPVGRYSVNGGYFNTGVDNGTLHALSTAAAGGNGVYVYGGGFPTNSFNATNYWVDPIFDTVPNDTLPPTVTAVTPANGATGVSPGATLSATFSETMDASTINSNTVQLHGPTGALIPATVTYNPSTRTATIAPAAPLANSTLYSVTVSGGTPGGSVTDDSGNMMAADFTWTFGTAASLGSGPFTLWSDTTTPATASSGDTNAVELGMKFRSDIDGFVTGIRFYKGSANIGTHVGHLWSATGALLATVNFQNESATGWQTATLTTPLAVTANTTYVVSYFAPVGGYALNGGFFNTGFDNGPLHALSTAAAGGNGVYVYGGGFPVNTFNAGNYWVDVVLNTSATDNTPPTVSSVTPASGATNVAPTVPITVTFNEAMDAASISSSTIQLRGPGNVLIPATVNYNASTRTATLTPSTALGDETAYSVIVLGQPTGASVADTAGNRMAANFTWSFTTAAPIGSGPFGFWTDTTLPATASVSDDRSAVELGMKFRADVDGFITAIRFYKGSLNTGTHVGHLWSATGALLATVNFQNESATGWQTATLTSPLAVTANTTYVVSYLAPNGGYAVDGGYFNTGFDNGPLHAPSSASSSGNGVYLYGGGFPVNNWNATNYWVDVVFTTALVDNTPPAVSTRSPAVGATGVSPTTTVTATFNERVQPGTIAFVLRDAANNTIPATVAYDEATRTVTLTPTAGLNPSTTYTATLSGTKDLAGNTMTAAVTWSFTTGIVTQTFTQTTAADFNPGTQDNTTVTAVSGGEVQLLPSFNDDFAGASLGSAWSSSSWAPLGGGPTSVTVSGGQLSVGGAGVFSTATLTTATVEGRLSFGAAPYQNFGLATDLATAAGNYWAVFGTGGTSNTLFARVNANGATQDVNLGALPAGFHVYRVRPVTGGFQFWVDGVLQTTVNAAFAGGTALKIAASAFAGSPPLLADYLRVAAYPAAGGTFTSSVLNAGTAAANWVSASWNATLPTGASLIVETRTGGTATPDATWSAWTAVAADGTIASPDNRYLQYRVRFSTTDTSHTAVFNDISIIWS